ncbi:MAG: hypothetical protein HYU64_15605 [Armatimonadetes bacterium]|nr:hypothetical protein [Armatimonadota bacterium]
MADLEKKLEKAETSLLIMRNVLHTLSPSKTQKYVAIADTLAREVLTSIKERKENLRLRRLALIPIWAFVLGMVSIIAMKRRALKMKRVESNDSP